MATTLTLRYMLVPQTSNIDANSLDYYLGPIKALTYDNNVYVQESSTSDYLTPLTICFYYSTPANDAQISNSVLPQFEQNIGVSNLITWNSTVTLR